LVDRLRLMIFPPVLGAAGQELIFAAYPLATFELIDMKVLDSRLVLLEYHQKGA
jgi:hypothetical protein